MILFWMNAFKKPNAEQDEALKQMFMALNAQNQKKLLKHYGWVIAGYLIVALACLIVTIGFLSFYFIVGSFGIGTIFDIVFLALSIYATYTSCSWFAAKPYQRILINMGYAERLYNTQDNSQSTAEIAGEIVEQTKTENNAQPTTNDDNQQNKG